MSNPNPNPNTDGDKKPGDNLTEEVLKQSGKSQEEIDRMGKLDRGDEDFESTFDKKYQTAASPVHRAVWGERTPVQMFAPMIMTDKVDPIHRQYYLNQIDKCIDFVVQHRLAGTVYGADNKVSDEVINGLAALGYWGALIDPKYGGWGVTITDVMKLITRMAAEGDATVAGMLSIHACIGLVDPLNAFGNDAQKAKYLPQLASGLVLSAFALTEPNAGSDLTQYRAHKE